MRLQYPGLVRVCHDTVLGEGRRCSKFTRVGIMLEFRYQSTATVSLEERVAFSTFQS